MWIKYLMLITGLLLVIEFYFKIANRFNITDRPNERSSHKEITVRGGGILFVVAGITYFFWSGFQYPFFFIGLFAVSIISFLDDIYTLSNKVRLSFQFLAISCILYQLEFTSQYSLFYVFLFLVLGVWVINAYNFMDGINGLTGVYSLSVILTVWIINNHHFYFIDNDFFYFISASLLVFNFFNFRKKAVCFAGDVGSISMAVIVLFLITKLSIQEGNPIYFLFLSVYGVETFITIVQRLLLGENIFKAHRRHLFQILVNEKKIPHLLVTTLYTTIQLIISIFIIYNIRQSYNYMIILSAVLISGLVFVYCFVKFVLLKPKKVFGEDY